MQTLSELVAAGMSSRAILELYQLEAEIRRQYQALRGGVNTEDDAEWELTIKY